MSELVKPAAALICCCKNRRHVCSDPAVLGSTGPPSSPRSHPGQLPLASFLRPRAPLFRRLICQSVWVWESSCQFRVAASSFGRRSSHPLQLFVAIIAVRKGKTKLSDLMRAENPGSGKLKTAVPYIATEAPHNSAEAVDAPPHLRSYVNPSRSDIPGAVSCSESSITFHGTEEGIRNGTKQEDMFSMNEQGPSITTEYCQSAQKSETFSMNEQGPSHISKRESMVQSSSCLPSRNDNILSGDPYKNSADSLVRSAQDKTGCGITQGALHALVPGVGTGYEKHVDHNSAVTTDKVLPPVIPANMLHSSISDNGTVMKNGGGEYYVFNRNLLGGTSYEWPSVAPYFVSPEMQQRPAAADRLHLDVGYRWPTQFDQPFLPANHQEDALPIGYSNGKTM